ncbi:V-type ATP synthase subunit A [candidate division WOR-3 bacterium]|nr:V-type ATP synthase subunit A [candidate division WOR-3 bacterium]
MNKKEDVGRILKVAGPLVIADGMGTSRMYDVVKVSDKRLVGEVIELEGQRASIQVYEDTGGIGPGEPVYPTHEPLSVELGPGIIEGIYDGIQRPLSDIASETGAFIARGVEISALPRDRKWVFEPQVKKGDKVSAGDILGTVAETILIEHRIMVPPGLAGEIAEIKKGSFTVEDTVAVLKTEDGKKVEITMMQRWPVRKPRPYSSKYAPVEILSTGQRVIDTFFPLGKGGTACVPGPFGSGKTVIQHQLAKWADAEIVVYVGCGERGNEMTDVLIEFPELRDPKSGEPLMKRTVLIANTSNMPVAAREASVYTGITIAEYFRDMGYSVALMADSTSRWAEAMREISGRLEEMPGEEGYPAYLGARIAEFYERAGLVECLGSDERKGALSVIGAVSPPGGDLSDPVVQATLRVVKVFWSLEATLAYARHFPAISWLRSYSLYADSVAESVRLTLGTKFLEDSKEAMRLLQEEDELKEIVRLIGLDALSPKDRLIMEAARSIREDFLHQNAFHEIDTYASPDKQAKMLSAVLKYYRESRKALDSGANLEDLIDLDVKEKIARTRYIPEKERDSIPKIEDQITSEVSSFKKEVS